MENGIRLIPESPFERECIKFIDSKGIDKLVWEDEWNKTGNLLITTKKG